MIVRVILTIFHVKVQTFIVPAETCWYGNCKAYEEAAWGYNGNSKTHFNHISQYGANLCRSFLYHVQWPKITWCQSLYISQQPGVQTRQCQWEQVCRRAGLRQMYEASLWLKTLEISGFVGIVTTLAEQKHHLGHRCTANKTSGHGRH